MHETNTRIAQLVEHRSPKPKVLGSNPNARDRICRKEDELKIAFAIFLTLSYRTPAASGLTQVKATVCKTVIVSSNLIRFSFMELLV